MRPRRTDATPVDTLVFQCNAVGLPEPLREFRFHPKRRWRFDLAWETVYRQDGRIFTPALAVECEGGLYVNGRHVQGAGAEADMVKYAHAMMLGYRVLRVTPRHIQQGKAIAWIEQLLR